MLSGVLSEWQPADMQSKKSNQTKNHLKVINDDHPLPDCLRKYTALPYHAPENCGGSFPMKDIQHSHTTKSSDVCSQEGTASSETQKKKRCIMTAALVVVCAPVAGLRVPAHSVTAPSTGLWFLLPSSRCRFSPVRTSNNILAVFGADPKN